MKDEARLNPGDEVFAALKAVVVGSDATVGEIMESLTEFLAMEFVCCYEDASDAEFEDALRAIKEDLVDAICARRIEFAAMDAAERAKQ